MGEPDWIQARRLGPTCESMFATLAIEVPGAIYADAATLLEAARRGEADAQAALFEAHKGDVARQILRLTGDSSCVDDLVQEVFIAAFRRLDDFRGDAKIGTWLHRITINKVRNWWDSTHRRKVREAKANTRSVEVDPDTPDGAIEAADKLAQFYAALGDLPADYREAFVLRAIEELPLEAVSERLGVPLSTVSYRARRAEALLSAALAGDKKGGGDA